MVGGEARQQDHTPPPHTHTQRRAVAAARWLTPALACRPCSHRTQASPLSPQMTMDDEYMLYVYKVRPCDRKVRQRAPWRVAGLSEARQLVLWSGRCARRALVCLLSAAAHTRLPAAPPPPPKHTHNQNRAGCALMDRVPVHAPRGEGGAPLPQDAHLQRRSVPRRAQVWQVRARRRVPVQPRRV
jgi:hypothetical protein